MAPGAPPLALGARTLTLTLTLTRLQSVADSTAFRPSRNRTTFLAVLSCNTTMNAPENKKNAVLKKNATRTGEETGSGVQITQSASA